MRHRYIDCTLEPTLDALIVALCADFGRREELIADKSLSLRTAAELRYLNYIISEATAEIVSAPYINLYISEIGTRTGYAHTLVPGCSEATYKMNKQAVKASIANKLHLF